MAPPATHTSQQFSLPAVQHYIEDNCISVRRTLRGEAFFDVSTPSGRISVRLFHVQGEDLLTVVAYAKDKVPRARIDDASALLCKFNYESPGSAYLTIDPRDGEVAARTAMPLASVIGTASAVAALVEATVELIAGAVPVLPGMGLGTGRAVMTFLPMPENDIN